MFGLPTMGYLIVAIRLEPTAPTFMMEHRSGRVLQKHHNMANYGFKMIAYNEDKINVYNTAKMITICVLYRCILTFTFFKNLNCFSYF